ncbi:unnamed protein product [Lupinus luteus]|uniref:Uncharacterized protein n=1 Tax=Lupinus luteus TaxID=3873 RepID=A0AAV1Y7C6_LUPLU
MHYMEDPYLGRTHKPENFLQRFLELTMENHRQTYASLRNLETKVGVITSYLSEIETRQPEEPPTTPIKIEKQPSTHKVKKQKKVKVGSYALST